MAKLELMLREGRSLSGSERNAVFLNLGDDDKRFADISALSGFDQSGDGRGMALSDWDRDGDLDVWLSNRTAPTVQVFENTTGRIGGGFIALELEGRECNRDAIGARVEVKPGSDAVIVQSLRAGEGFQSQGSKRLHIGIGAADGPLSVRVRWPGSRDWEAFTGVQANAFHRLVQGSGSARLLPEQNGGSFEAAKPSKPSVADAGETPSGNGILLAARPLFPQLEFLPIGQQTQPEAPTSAKPTLLLLWDPQCERCCEEMTALAKDKSVIEDLGLRCVALTGEPGPEEQEIVSLVNRRLAETGFPFEAGFAPAALIERMLALHRHLYYRPYNFVVPMSFLLDEDGRLAAVYRGAVDLAQLRDHCSALPLAGDALVERSMPLGGSRLIAFDTQRPAVLIKDYLEAGMPDEAERVLRADRNHSTVAEQLADVLSAVGNGYLVSGKLASAKRLLMESLSEEPQNPRTLNNLGAAHLGLGESAEAIEFWQQALQLNDDYAEPMLNLGKQLLREKRTREAMNHLISFHGLKPDNPDGHNYLSIGYLRDLDFENAKTHLIRLLELRPNDANAVMNLSKVHLRLGDRRAAISLIDQSIESGKLDPVAEEKLRQMRLRLGL